MGFRFAFSFMIFILSFFCPIFSFEKVVIWGHKLHSHTHSYVHDAFYRAFKYLGYDAYHFDNNDHLANFDFSNTLFLTEGQADQRIPLREDCFYILHNCDQSKYRHLISLNKCIGLQVYTDDVLGRSHAVRIELCIHKDLTSKILYMPWAADLLPHEIEAKKILLKDDATLEPQVGSKYLAWVGTIGDGYIGNRSELQPFISAAQDAGISFAPRQGLDPGAAELFVEKAYMAPTIVGSWQKEKGYIPCRIFKNSSYGQMPITNSYRVYELFNKKIIYDSNTEILFQKAQAAITSFGKKEKEELMDFIKEKHTYVSRIQTLLNFIDEVKKL